MARRTSLSALRFLPKQETKNKSFRVGIDRVEPAFRLASKVAPRTMKFEQPRSFSMTVAAQMIHLFAVVAALKHRSTCIRPGTLILKPLQIRSRTAS
jgi:hypothetical protein